MLIFLAAVGVLIFPIFPSIFFYVNKNEKTALFLIKIVGITIFRIKLTLNDNGILVEKSFKQPYYIKFSLPKLNMRDGIKKIKKIGILSVSSTVSFGINENEFSDYAAIFSLQTTQIVIFSILKTEKPFLKINNEIRIFENNDTFNAFVRLKTVLNIIDLILILFYNLTEKIHYAISK